MGLSRLFFAWESTELLGTPSQMHRHVDNNLISQLTTTRVGWRWVDSRGLELPSQIFQTNFIKTNFSNEFHLSKQIFQTNFIKIKTNVLLPSE